MDLSRSFLPRVRLSTTLLLPALLAGTVATGGIVLHDQQRKSRLQDYRTETRVTAEQVSYRLSAWLRDRVAIVGYLSQFGGAADRNIERFKQEAATFVDRVPGFQALNWIDNNGIISAVVPLEPNKGALGKNLLENPQEHVRDAVSKALNERIAARTHSIDLYQGGRGISMYFPVNRDGGGVVNGVFRVDAIMSDALPDMMAQSQYRLEIIDQDGQQIYATGPLSSDQDYVYDHPILFVDRPLRLRVAGVFPAVLDGWPHSPLWVGGSLLAGLLLGLMLHFYLQRQRQFRHQGQQLRLIMDSTVEGMLGLDLDGVCVFCNAASVIELGCESDREVIGKRILHERLYTRQDDDSLEIVKILGAVRQGLTRESRASFMRRSNGSEFAVEYLATPVIDNANVVGAVVTFFDITGELTEAERLSRYQQVMDSVPELTLQTDAEGRIETINPAGLNMLKAPSESLRGRPLLDLLTPASREQIDADALPTLMRRGVWEGESELLAADGTAVPARMVMLRLEDRFGDVYYSLIARDITEDRRMESEQRSLRQQFQHAQKMESLGLLAGGIAHDFNNILVAVLGNASLAMEKLTPGSPEHGLLSAVETATQRAADLTRQLLAYSGRGRFELAATDIGDLVTEMAGLLRASTPPSVQLTVQCEDDLPAAMVDPTQIRQLVMNLITNGSDAVGTADEGRVRVFVQRLQWDPANSPKHLFGQRLPKGEYVAIKVEDSGPGMSPEVIARIFDPFFSTKPSGKGLGLSAVLGIVQGHNGMLCVESSAEEGTCFMLALPPCKELPAAELADDDGAGHTTFAGEVLLIDDEPLVREFAEAALSTLGFTVHVAVDGRDGLNQFAMLRDKLALVLIDQSMPGMSGAETRQHMREIDDRVPAILMSGYDEQQVSATLEDMGFGGFLKKPFRYAELRLLLSRLLERAA